MAGPCIFVRGGGGMKVLSKFNLALNYQGLKWSPEWKVKNLEKSIITHPKRYKIYDLRLWTNKTLIITKKNYSTHTALYTVDNMKQLQKI